jgi:hypothetical protein
VAVRNSLAVIGVLGCTAAITGCAGSSPPSAAPATAASHVRTVARGSLRAATLDLTSGATTVTVEVTNVAGALLRVSTPATSGQRPTIALSGDGVADVGLASIGSGGSSAIDITLAPGIAWSIDLDGGATVENIDMRGGVLARLDLTAGVSQATIALPSRTGTQLIHEVGGASEIELRTSSAAATKVAVIGGAGRVRLGGVSHSGVAGGTTYSSPGYRTAPSRVDLELTGGVSDVDVHAGDQAAVAR